MPTSRLQRPATLAVVLAIAAGLTALAGVATRPVRAGEQPVQTIKVGQQIVIKAPSPVGQGKALRVGFSLNPANCKSSQRSSSYCDSYPIKIDAPADVLATHDLLFTAKLEWANGVRVDNCPQIGNCGSNEMDMQIWEDPPNTRTFDPGPVGIGECNALDPNTPGYEDVICPPSEPSNAPSAEAGGFYGTPDSPILLGLIGAGKKKAMWVNVGNYVGSNPYTLTLKLEDFTGRTLVDASAVDDLPLDLSEGGPTGVDAAGPLDDLPEPAPVVQAPTLGAPVTVPPSTTDVDPNSLLPGAGGSEQSLDAAAGGGAVLSDADLAAAIADKALKPLPVPGDVSGAVVALWLALLPLGGGGWFFFLLARRRRSEEETTA